MKNYSRALISLTAGGLLVLAFAPFAYRFMAFFSPALLLWCLLDANRREASLYGFLFGLGFFGFGASWVFISINTYGEAPLFISLIITLLFVVTLSLFSALMGTAFSFFKSSMSYSCLAIFPTLWVCFEWLRSWILTGFPWLFLGYTQVDTSLKYFAPIVGVYGLSFIICLISGALILLIKGQGKEKLAALFCILLVWSGTTAFSHYALKTENPQRVSVALIQGNIPQSLKWNSEQALKSLKLYKALTETQSPNTLITWPEAAIPIFQSQANAYLVHMNHLLKEKNQILITGIPIATQTDFYNGLLMLGEAKGEYRKIHLLPFGEYYPLKWLLGPLFDYLKIPMSDLTPGVSSQPLLNANGIRIAPFLCYEIAFPQQVLKQAQDAELLITLSDDSWFGDSIASAQHLEIAQLRALETQRYMLFNTNSGISAIITPGGHIAIKLGMNEQGVIHGQIHTVQGLTPLMRWGYTPLALMIGLLLVIGIKRRMKRV